MKKMFTFAAVLLLAMLMAMPLAAEPNQPGKTEVATLASGVEPATVIVVQAPGISLIEGILLAIGVATLGAVGYLVWLMNPKPLAIEIGSFPPLKQQAEPAPLPPLEATPPGKKTASTAKKPGARGRKKAATATTA